MPKMNFKSRIVSELLKTTVFKDATFMVLDVGASGGLEGVWRQFEPKLRAHCFDPLVNEVKRLNAAEATSDVQYHAAWLTTSDPEILAGKTPHGYSTTENFQFTSAMHAVKQMSFNYNQKFYNQEKELVYSDQHISVDDFCANQKLEKVDFIKTDTDGYDYYVLNGCEKTIKTKTVLGFMVEANFHGSTHPHGNNFANIDIFMRKHGYTLFQMDVWRYTRAALPGKFYMNIPAQTEGGQAQWGDVLYIVDPLVRTELFETCTPADFAKLIMLYDIFDLPDCAAALINELIKRKITLPGVNYDTILNMLVPPNPYNLTTYKDYMAFFDKDPSKFYSTPWNEAEKGSPAVTDIKQNHAKKRTISLFGTKRA